jgi:hypothetical protein
LAARQAINKTVVGVRTDLATEFRKLRALKSGEIKNDFISIRKASGFHQTSISL